jgi:hypothetical protein
VAGGAGIAALAPEIRQWAEMIPENGRIKTQCRRDKRLWSLGWLEKPFHERGREGVGELFSTLLGMR